MKISLIFFLAYSSLVYGQKGILEYDITNRGKSIGVAKLSAQTEGTNSSIKMDSDVEIRFIASIRIKMHEESIYQKDRLMYSEGKRTVNGTNKLNNQTKASDNFYTIVNNGKATILRVPSINYNLLLFYYKEPVNIEKVYSDTFQQFVKIERIEPHHYKLQLPNGDFNEYYFKNGICKRVIIHSTFYQIEMNLKADSTGTPTL